MIFPFIFTSPLSVSKSKTSKFLNIVALPFGTPYNSKHDNFEHILLGEYNGVKYETEATLRVGWESDYSPFSQKFNKQFLKRIRAYDNNGNLVCSHNAVKPGQNPTSFGEYLDICKQYGMTAIIDMKYSNGWSKAGEDEYVNQILSLIHL